MTCVPIKYQLLWGEVKSWLKADHILGSLGKFIHHAQDAKVSLPLLRIGPVSNMGVHNGLL